MNRLPPEIVSHIAQYVLQDELDARPIIPLTHVCKYWRDSIVSAPKNWTRIFNGVRGLAELSLERAKAAPLDVFLIFDSETELFDFGSGYGRDFIFDFLLPYMRNIVSLNCTGFTSIEEITKALPNFPKSMPNLQSLALTGHGLKADQSRGINLLDFSTHTTLRGLTLTHFPLLPSFLGLRTLTELKLRNPRINLHLDTILTFLEENRSLKRATLGIGFGEDSLRRPQRQTPIKSSLQSLSICCNNERDIEPLISNIALRKGASLEIIDYDSRGLTRILSRVPTTHLPGLLSPFSMEYQVSPREIRLLGPDGSFSYADNLIDSIGGPPGRPLFGGEFSLLPLASIRKLRLKFRESWVFSQSRLSSFPSQFQLSSFPSLEVLSVDSHDVDECSTDDEDSTDEDFTDRDSADEDSTDEASTPNISGPIGLSLSPLLQELASSPSPKTLAFLDCSITEDFMAKLARVALDRRNRTSGSLCRVVIVNSKGIFPSAGSVERLGKYVPIVEVIKGKELPKDLL